MSRKLKWSMGPWDIVHPQARFVFRESADDWVAALPWTITKVDWAVPKAERTLVTVSELTFAPPGYYWSGAPSLYWHGLSPVCALSITPPPWESGGDQTEFA